MGILEKTDQIVSEKATQVFETLGRVKFLLVTVPVICVLVGLAMQQLIPERNIATTTFKLGTFATPDQRNPDPLAGENQMRSRMRTTSLRIAKEDFRGGLLLTITVTNDVVMLVATAKGPEETRQFLRQIAQTELDFQNGRLEKLQAIQSRRRESLEESRAGYKARVAQLAEQQKSTTDAVGMLAVQQELDNAKARIASISKELDTMALLNASDLYIDTSQFIQEPLVFASSNWYRPILYGAIGLAVGLFLIVIIFFVSMIRSFSSKRADKKKKIEENEEMKEQVRERLAESKANTEQESKDGE